MNIKQPELGGSKTYMAKIVVYNDQGAVDSHAANILIDQIGVKPNSILTLPTGNTPLGMYEKLLEAYRQRRLDFRTTTVFNLDEYYPISPTHPNSYAQYMRGKLVDLVNIGDWFIPNGGALDCNAEVERYQQLLTQHEPVDLAIVGLGPGKTCHIGFNERGSPLTSGVRYVKLDRETKESNAMLFDDPSEIPNGAITQGIADILRAKRILLIAKGPSKAWGVNRVLNGRISPTAPASFLQYHPDVTFLLDTQAAQKLR